MPSLPPKNHASPFASLRGNHVAVRVRDFEAARAWYVEKLDFRMLERWSMGPLELAYLAPPADDDFTVELLAGASPISQPAYADFAASMQAAGYHHFCLTVDNVDATIDELRRRGVTIVREPFDLEAIGRRLAFVADPWGNLIEFAHTIR